jgi:hypothetical protein
MKTETVGAGSAYFGAYRDKDLNWFEGGQNYRMHGPEKPLFEKTWSLPDFEPVK